MLTHSVRTLFGSLAMLLLGCGFFGSIWTTTRIASVFQGGTYAAWLPVLWAVGLTLGGAVGVGVRSSGRSWSERVPLLLGLSGILWVLHGVTVIDTQGDAARAVLYVAALLPTFIFGAGLSTFLQVVRRITARFVGGLLLGGAASVPLVILLLPFGAPRALLAFACMTAFGGIGLSVWCLPRWTQGGFGPLAVGAATVALFGGDLGERWFEGAKAKEATASKFLWSSWNEQGFISVDRPSRGIAWVRRDADAPVSVLAERADVTPTPEIIAYQGAPKSVLLMGTHGGKSLRMAAENEPSSLIVVEGDFRFAVTIMEDKLAQHTGELFAKQRPLIFSPSGFIDLASNRGDRFDVVVVALVDDPVVPTFPGELSAGEGLYSLETVTALYGLAKGRAPEGSGGDGGIVALTHWNERGAKLEDLARSVLARAGKAPQDFAFHCRNAEQGTVFLAHRPIADLGLVEACGARGFESVLFGPSAPTGRHPVIGPSLDRPSFFDRPTRLGANLEAVANLRAIGMVGLVVASILGIFGLSLQRSRAVAFGARSAAVGFGGAFFFGSIPRVLIVIGRIDDPIDAALPVFAMLSVAGSVGLISSFLSVRPRPRSPLLLAIALAGLSLLRFTSFTGLPVAAVSSLALGALVGASLRSGLVRSQDRSRRAFDIVTAGLGLTLGLLADAVLSFHLGASFAVLASALPWLVVGSLLLPRTDPHSTQRLER